MIKSYFKIAWRNLLKQRQFSILNIAGLSIGLACALMIFLWVNDEIHIDRFNEKDERLFQVLQNWPSPTGTETTDQTPGLLATSLAAEFPEIENTTAVIPSSSPDRQGILSANNKKIPVAAQFAGKDYFNVFSYKLIEGNNGNALAAKNSVVLSASLALKLFNSIDIVGKTIEWNQKDFSGNYIITGVFENPPQNSTARFDIIFSYDLFLQKNPKLENWGNNDPFTYIVLKKNTDINQFNHKVADFIKSKNKDARQTLVTQKYSDRYLHNHFENGLPSGGRIEYVKLFSIIAIFILLIASINFMNLSTAKAAGRMKEIGLKKLMGADRVSLIFQYTCEAVMMSFLSLVIALLLVFLFLPVFNTVTGKQLTFFDSSIILPATVITLITGLIAGSYPALYLSGFKPIVALNGKLKISMGEGWVRKGLVVFQFALSAIFIVTVLVVYKQMQLIQTKNLGYNRENVIWFDKGGLISDNPGDYKPGGKYETDLESFLQQIKTIPGVVNAANFRHNITDRNGGTSDISWEGKDPNSKIDFTDIGAGYDFIETMNIQIKEGRSFSKEFGSEKSKIIFNEAAIDQMGMKNPVGKAVHLWGEDRQIIAVVKNFNFRSLHEKLGPCFFDLSTNQRASKIMVKMQTGKEKETIQGLERFYKQYSQGLPFEYRFLDEDYQALYSSETKVGVLSKWFAGIAIVISCLGLFGLAAFTAEKRRKEISIRKVAGATTSNIVSLLCKDFIKLVLLAILIALPLASWIVNGWLNGFAYRVHPGWIPFLVTGVSIVLITLLTISFQSIKAASANPSKSLRME